MAKKKEQELTNLYTTMSRLENCSSSYKSLDEVRAFLYDAISPFVSLTSGKGINFEEFNQWHDYEQGSKNRKSCVSVAKSLINNRIKYLEEKN